MKIAEVVGSDLDDEFTRAAPDAALTQQIAAAFTRSGQVKANWDAARLGGEQDLSSDPRPLSAVPSTTVIPSSGVAGLTSDEAVQPVDNMHVEPRSVMAPGSTFQHMRAVQS